MPKVTGSCIFNFMKNLVVFSAAIAALLTAYIAPTAYASARPEVQLDSNESNSVMAVRALVSRCLPGVLSGNGATTAGLARASDGISHKMLGERAGTVWFDSKAHMMMIDFHDAPTCRIIATPIDPAVMADLVMRVFSEAETPFVRKRFSLHADGGFAAVYTSAGDGQGVVIRISTDRLEDGRRFATLSVEKEPTETARME